MSTLSSLKRRKKQHKPINPFAGLKRKLAEREDFKDQRVVFNPRGEEKMSEVLEDFAEPYREYAHKYEEHHKLLTLCVVAWNASLLPKDKRKEMIDSVVEEVMPVGGDEMKSILGTMIARKEAMFAENKRTIVDFELTDLGDGWHLSVVSTLSVNK